ncbi:hypothetical protein LRD18_12710 [Halorhodospira halochloris]|uniref:hypothetical protein n=1 Tax=Halorhodospira halochloris TaxID=1052 RepID=UPI001EE87526|nr:hypothetical protein [Halorhodospira halochloris]MCG5531698.1 hypothetical protein [Halorhodospira halochloris]
MTQSLTRQALHSQLKSLLAEQDAEGLRALLHAMADECHPRERAGFLEWVRNGHRGVSSESDSDTSPNSSSGYNAQNLDSALENLTQALEMAKEESDIEPPSAGYDDEYDELGPFADVMPLFSSVLEQIGSELRHGHAEAARSAYEQIWDLIDYVDDYGRRPSLEADDPEGAREHKARYLRSVYLTTDPDQRPAALCEAAEQARSSGFMLRPRSLYLSLHEVNGADLAALPDWDSTLRQLITFLEERFDPLSDLWLREATYACYGIDGITELAHRAGISRPLAWLDAAGIHLRGKYVAALAALLAGRWDLAKTLAQEPGVLGWSSGTNAKHAVFVYMLVALSTNADAEPGPVTTLLWSDMLTAGVLSVHSVIRSHELPDGDKVYLGERHTSEVLASGYREALEQALTHHPLDEQESETWMSWCMDSAAERCEDIVGNKRRRAYPRAARAIIGCYEVACARGQPEAGRQFVFRMSSTYPRHSAFQRALQEEQQTPI